MWSTEEKLNLILLCKRNHWLFIWLIINKVINGLLLRRKFFRSFVFHIYQLFVTYKLLELQSNVIQESFSIIWKLAEFWYVRDIAYKAVSSEIENKIWNVLV